jgi:GH18 family chitinase
LVKILKLFLSKKGEGGIQTYFEVCLRIKEGYKRYWDPVHHAAIAYNSQSGTWIGYDDPGSSEEKVCF